MEIRVLGELQVVHGESDLTPSGVRPRDLLAALVVRRGQVTPAAALLDLVWGATLAGSRASDVSVVHTVVARLRRHLGSDVVERHVAGYRLGRQISTDESAFSEALGRAHEADSRGDLNAAIGQLRRGLRFWRGPQPYAGVSDHVVLAERAQLAEAIVRAKESLAGLLVRRGETADFEDALGLALELIEEDPLRESAYEIAMRAEYASGRQAQALELHRQLVRCLREDLGVTPGPRIGALLEEILTHDPVLTAAPSAGGSAPQPARTGPLVPTIGREADVERVLASLHDKRRLVTITGIGGVGKSHLLAEVATRLPARQTCHVDLAGVLSDSLPPERAPAAVVDAIARGLAVPLRAGEAVPALVSALAHRTITLLIDEAEWAPDAVGLVVESILGSCPDVSCIVTSRVPLDVRGERRIMLEPLAIPDPSADSAAALANPAVQLLRARIEDRVSGFTVSEETVAQLAEAARAVDGLPLALELIAAQVLDRPLSEMDELIANPLDLVANERDRSARQRSLRETLTWTLDRLDPAQRRLLAQLSCFHTVFTSSAASAIARPTASPSDLHLLARHALLQVIRTDTGVEFRMVRSVREIAAEDLTGAELATLRERHRAWFAATWRGAPRTDRLIHDVERRYDDYREGLRSGLRDGDRRHTGDLALTLSRVWNFRDAIGAGSHWLEQALASDAVSEVDRARISVRLASLLVYHDPQHALSLVEQAVPVLDRHGDVVDLITGLIGHALLLAGQGLGQRARVSAQQAVARARLGAPARVPDALAILAISEAEAGCHDDALSSIEAAWQAVADSGSIAAIAPVGHNLTYALLMLDRVQDAVVLSDRLAQLAESSGTALPNFVHLSSAWATLAAGERERALAHIREVVAALGDATEDQRAAEVFVVAACALTALGDERGAVVCHGAADLVKRTEVHLAEWQRALWDTALRAAPTGPGAPRWMTAGSRAVGAELQRLVCQA